jgi:uncharacterized BrkB/YihY/UPF0761 family membrane protein
MTDQRPSRIRRRREQLEAMLAGGQARLERARSRSVVVDTMVGVVRRERPVAVGILAASLAFRLFAMMVPLIYVLVAGLGLAAQASADQGTAPHPGDELADLVVASVADATHSSERARWLALIFGGVATLVAAAAVLEVLRWVHLLAWRMTPSRSRASAWLVLGLIAGVAVQVVVLAVLWLALSLAMPRPPSVPRTALAPGALLFGAGFQAFSVAVSLWFAPRAARASTLYGSLGVALVLLVSLFLFARLAVAAAELNATLVERRRLERSADIIHGG